MSRCAQQSKIPSGRKLLSLIANMLKELIITQDHNDAVYNSLENIVEMLNVDKVYIFSLQKDGDELIASQRYKYFKEKHYQDIESTPKVFSLRSSGFGRWADAFEAGEIIEGSVSTFPKSEQKRFKKDPNMSLLCIPVFVEKKLWGFFALDKFNKVIEWSTKDKETLEMFANVLVSSIYTYEQDGRLIEEQKRFMQFYELVQNSPIEIHIFNLETMQFVYMNKTALDSLGYDEDEYKELTQSEITYGIDSEHIIENLSPLLDNIENSIVVNSFQKRKNGSIYPVEINFSKMIYDGSEHMVAMSNDISERYVVERELDEQKKMFEDLFRGSADAVVIFKENNIIDVNDATLEMFEYTKEEIITLTLDDLSAPRQLYNVESSSTMKEMIAICLTRGNHRFEWLCKKREGESFWSDIVLTKLHLEEHSFIHIVLRDITKRKEDEIMILSQQNQLSAANDTLNKRYEEELRLRQELEFYKTQLEKEVESEVQKNREKDRMLHNQSKSVQMGEMLSMIAHQWRQPLNAISASAITIAMKQELDELDPLAINEHTQFIQKHTQQMSKTINDFMNFFKPEHEKKPFTVIEMMDEILSLMEVQLRSRGISVRFDENSAIEINGYRKELSHVVINLITNARDAYETINIREKFIDIGFKRDRDNWIISVEDHAGGISPEHVDKIFDPYFTTKEQGEGTGIGLYMSRRIIQEAFSGTINVINSNEGAKFIIKVPDI